MDEYQEMTIRAQVQPMLEGILKQTTRNLEADIRKLTDKTSKQELSYIGNSLTGHIFDKPTRPSGSNSEIPRVEGSILSTSNQLRAARALIGLGQIALAERAGLNVNTIRRMEAEGSGPLPGLSANVQAVQRALEKAGVEFLGGDQPGVRLRRNDAQGR